MNGGDPSEVRKQLMSDNGSPSFKGDKEFKTPEVNAYIYDDYDEPSSFKKFNDGKDNTEPLRIKNDELRKEYEPDSKPAKSSVNQTADEIPSSEVKEFSPENKTKITS
jgi:hypothetical protein